MDPSRLAQLLATESERVEWKQSTRDGDGIVEAVCALANDLGASDMPGFVLVGVNKHGEVVGIEGANETVDEAQRRIAGRVFDVSLQPTPSVSFHIVSEGGRSILVLEVQPYAVPPAVTWRGVARVRVGTTTRRATEADLLRLQERRPENRWPFDSRPVPESTLADLDLVLLRARFDEERNVDTDVDTFPSFEKWLDQQGLVRFRNGVWVPNAAALLLFGKDPQTRFPGAYVDLVRYAGNDADAPVAHRKPARGTLTDQLTTLWNLLQREVVSVPGPKQGIVEAFVEEYPFPALEELVRNMVQHRSYDATNAPGRIEWFDDRIELTNPGGPYGQASASEFGEHSDYRNPTITKHLASLGYVQQLGRGVRRVRALLKSSGSPPLEVETDGFTRVVIRRRST